MVPATQCESPDQERHQDRDAGGVQASWGSVPSRSEKKDDQRALDPQAAPEIFRARPHQIVAHVKRARIAVARVTRLLRPVAKQPSLRLLPSDSPGLRAG